MSDNGDRSEKMGQTGYENYDDNGGNGNQDGPQTDRPSRVVLLHGFDDQAALTILRAVKQVCDEPEGIAFSMTTATNINWKVGELLREVIAEHMYMTQRQRQDDQDKGKGEGTEGSR